MQILQILCINVVSSTLERYIKFTIQLYTSITNHKYLNRTPKPALICYSGECQRCYIMVAPCFIPGKKHPCLRVFENLKFCATANVGQLQML